MFAQRSHENWEPVKLVTKVDGGLDLPKAKKKKTLVAATSQSNDIQYSGNPVI